MYQFKLQQYFNTQKVNQFCVCEMVYRAFGHMLLYTGPNIWIDSIIHIDSNENG